MKITRFGIIALVTVIGFALLGCVSATSALRSKNGFEELKLREGTYGPFLSRDVIFGQWLQVQPNVTGEIVVETSIDADKGSRKTRFSIELEAYNNQERRISRVRGSGQLSDRDFPPRLVFQAEAGKRYFLKVKVKPSYAMDTWRISAFNAAQREEARRFAEKERLRVEAAKAAEAKAEAKREEEKRQAEAAKQRAEQTRLANLYRQAGNNVGNFNNTSRTFSSTFLGDITIERYDFGNGNYLYEEDAPSFWKGLRDVSTETGTFRVNGDTVIFLSSKGKYSFGTILGNTLTINGDVYR